MRFDIDDYLSDYVGQYPQIQYWLKTRVLPGVANGVRHIVIAPGGSGMAIVKLAQGSSRCAKLCHLSLSPRFRGYGMGERLLKQAAVAALTAGATHLRVTTSEDTANIFGQWFERQGFAPRHWDKDRYRPGVTELEWHAANQAILY